MDVVKKKRLAIATIAISLLVVSLLLIGGVYFFLNQSKLVVIDEHQDLGIRRNPNFKFEYLDPEINAYLEEQGIDSISITLTDYPTVNMTSELIAGSFEPTSSQNIVQYVGNESKQEGNNLNVRLYVRTQSIFQLAKDEPSLQRDLLQQFLLALDHEQQKKIWNGLRPSEDYKDKLPETNQKTFIKANALLESGQQPFVVLQ